MHKQINKGVISNVESLDNLNSLLEGLNNLKSLGCSGIKISLEDEGSQLNEIMTMRYLTSLLDLKLSIKIGGCEAKSDITNCCILCSDVIIAPMIESNFALQKFIASIQKSKYHGKIGFNLETITGVNNINSFIPLLSNVDSIVFGRVDYVSSLGKDRNVVDDCDTLNTVYNVFKTVKSQISINTCLGGGISSKSKEFITKLVENELLDYFETRYVIFDTKKINVNSLDILIHHAAKFELQWLQFVKQRYNNYSVKDGQRILMIEDRFKTTM